MVKGSDFQHEYIVDNLYRNFERYSPIQIPSQINSILVDKELKAITKSICKPDLFVKMTENQILLVEVKSSNSPSAIKEGEKDIWRMYLWHQLSNPNANMKYCLIYPTRGSMKKKGRLMTGLKGIIYSQNSMPSENRKPQVVRRSLDKLDDKLEQNKKQKFIRPIPSYA